MVPVLFPTDLSVNKLRDDSACRPTLAWYVPSLPLELLRGCNGSHLHSAHLWQHFGVWVFFLGFFFSFSAPMQNHPFPFLVLSRMSVVSREIAPKKKLILKPFSQKLIFLKFFNCVLNYHPFNYLMPVYHDACYYQGKTSQCHIKYNLSSFSHTPKGSNQ